MENAGGDAHSAIERVKWAVMAPLHPGTGHRTHGSLEAPMERGEVHCLPDGDPPVRSTRHQVLQDPTTDKR